VTVSCAGEFPAVFFSSSHQTPMHLRCTQVHEYALRLWGLCIGVGIGIGFDSDSDADSDPESFLECSRVFSKQSLMCPGRTHAHEKDGFFRDSSSSLSLGGQTGSVTSKAQSAQRIAKDHLRSRHAPRFARSCRLRGPERRDARRASAARSRPSGTRTTWPNR
jgi:hypothetical protein